VLTAGSAQASLDRRAAAAALAGAMLGSLPLLWLIREALDEHVGAGKPLRFYKPVALLRYGCHWFLLNHGERHIVEEYDENDAHIRSHDVPNAALILHEAVRHDPVAAENLITTIERATKAASP
jgi:hypothetical protein